MGSINIANWNVEQVVDWVTGLDSDISRYVNGFHENGITGERLLTMMAGDLDYLVGITAVGDQLLMYEAINTLRQELTTPYVTLQYLSLSLSVRCKNYRAELSCEHITRVNSHPIIPTCSLSSASYLLDAGKHLIRWLTRFPFIGKLNYDEISRKLTKHCFELAVLSQRDSFADNAIEEVQYLCTKMCELCEVLINSNDSLVIQPAGIDVITLRKRTDQDWGLLYDSSVWGVHTITGVRLNTAAQQSGHLERGDEILQINYQTIVGWPQTSVYALLHENENECFITVKRRPRHANSNLLLIGGGAHQNTYLNKIPNRKSFFERKAKEVSIKPKITVQETPSATAPKATVNPNARFWKLYPKPKYLIKRRATVTGASPTDTRPPVTFINDSDSPPVDPEPVRPHVPVSYRRSTPIGSMNLLNPPSRPPLDKSRSAPEEETNDETTDEVFISPPPPPPPTVLHKGTLHVRSQLRKQASNSKSMIGNSPRWIRQNATFYSDFNLTFNSVGGSVLTVSIARPSQPFNADAFNINTANEVHSRPFAFKITRQDGVTYYLAAESQYELDAWMSVLTSGAVKKLSSAAAHRSVYKRSISLGGSSGGQGSDSRVYGSQSTLETKQRVTLKSDWFLRNSSSNISSITISSKKVTTRSVQYPTPQGTPTHTPVMPSMGLSVKTKKSSSSSSPTRKYVCPNCCHTTKVDIGTQTEESLQIVFFNNESSV